MTYDISHAPYTMHTLEFPLVVVHRNWNNDINGINLEMINAGKDDYRSGKSIEQCPDNKPAHRHSWQEGWKVTEAFDLGIRAASEGHTPEDNPYIKKREPGHFASAWYDGFKLAEELLALSPQ